jgi:lipopolysaccharide export LptBFGC system permease protein LptF
MLFFSDFVRNDSGKRMVAPYFFSGAVALFVFISLELSQFRAIAGNIFPVAAAPLRGHVPP